MTNPSLAWQPEPAPLDRVLQIVPTVRARAIRNVPATLSILDAHFPRLPVLPGVILLGSMAALAGLVVGDGAWRLSYAAAVRFRHFVRPGDSVLIDVSAVEIQSDEAVFRAQAQVDGRIVANAQNLTLVRPISAADTR